MDPMIRWAMRLAQWFRRPPSRERAILIGVTIGLCLALVLVERVFGWPEWATLGGGPRIIRH
ncbi:MAG: hypothetical protein K5Q68_04405 [Roseococcus sp.]|nr:hypothetical protein [Roseococcus sp.]